MHRKTQHKRHFFRIPCVLKKGQDKHKDLIGIGNSDHGHSGVSLPAPCISGRFSNIYLLVPVPMQSPTVPVPEPPNSWWSLSHLACSGSDKPGRGWLVAGCLSFLYPPLARLLALSLLLRHTEDNYLLMEFTRRTPEVPQDSRPYSQ